MRTEKRVSLVTSAATKSKSAPRSTRLAWRLGSVHQLHEATDLLVDHSPHAEGADAYRHGADAQRRRHFCRAQFFDRKELIRLIILRPNQRFRGFACPSDDGLLQLLIDVTVQLD